MALEQGAKFVADPFPAGSIVVPQQLLDAFERLRVDDPFVLAFVEFIVIANLANEHLPILAASTSDHSFDSESKRHTFSRSTCRWPQLAYPETARGS